MHEELVAWEIAAACGSNAPPPDRAAIDQRREEEWRQRQQEAIDRAEKEQMLTVDTDTFEKELELEARLDGMIDRAVKRLMQIKAMKDMIGFRVREQPDRRAIEGPKAGSSDAMEQAQSQSLASKEG